MDILSPLIFLIPLVETNGNRYIAAALAIALYNTFISRLSPGAVLKLKISPLSF